MKKGDKLNMALIHELKKHEGEPVLFLYRGQLRPFILKAVQDVEPSENTPLINGQYKGSKIGEVYINYDYPNKSDWSGFWTDRIEDIVIKNTIK